MVNHDCKIDAHTPTEDGSACSCGYFVKAKEAARAGAELIRELVDCIREARAAVLGIQRDSSPLTVKDTLTITLFDKSVDDAIAALTKAQGSR